MKKHIRNLVFATAATALVACGDKEEAGIQVDAAESGSSSAAHGAPGRAPTWAFSAKTGIGTSYEAYVNGQHSDEAATGAVSKVWFSIANGVLTETMWGMIHEAQLKDLKVVVRGEDFVDVEGADTRTQISYLHTDAQGRPLSLAYRIVNEDLEGRYTIEKHLFTDPDGQALFHRLIITPKDASLDFYVMANPHMGNTGGGDLATVDDALHAWEGASAMTVLSAQGFEQSSAGFVGVSDLLADLEDGQQDWTFSSTGEVAGNVSLAAKLPVSGPTQLDLVLGFGDSTAASRAAAQSTLAQGYDAVLAAYNGVGDAVGWEDYLASLDGLMQIRDSAQDGGSLMHVSALVLKAQEDKIHSGALIASLSNPWGDTVSAERSSTGYKAVWPRDFYQCAMAFLALGDTETPQVAFEYLEKVQVTDKTPGNKGATGWFLQKTHVNGDLEWMAVQLDQTAMPIMLGWKLWHQGVMSDEEILHWYNTMLKPAADFLVDGGKLNLDWNTAEIIPPYTQQERWEEQEGYSPSTMAAVIAGLVSAADMAKLAGDNEAAQRYLDTADRYEAVIEAYTFTTTGVFDGELGNGRYYLRITQNEDPNDNGSLLDRNGRGPLNEKEILDGGFLELVRYGVRAANDEHVLDTLEELDNEALPDEFRVKYTFESENGERFPGWRRYGDDGYGEDADTGNGYAEGGENTPGQRGRVWPFFTGERGHYELARAKGEDRAQLASVYIAGMEYFANEGLMLPEQVWDGVGVDTPHRFDMGEGTNSATPLAWTHAEYIKLVRSIHDGVVWDHYPLVRQRYQN